MQTLMLKLLNQFMCNSILFQESVQADFSYDRLYSVFRESFSNPLREPVVVKNKTKFLLRSLILEGDAVGNWNKFRIL